MKKGTHLWRHTHTNTCTCAHTYTHICTRTLTSIYTRTLTHTYTHKHTRAHVNRFGQYLEMHVCLRYLLLWCAPLHSRSAVSLLLAAPLELLRQHSQASSLCLLRPELLLQDDQENRLVKCMWMYMIVLKLCLHLHRLQFRAKGHVLRPLLNSMIFLMLNS